VWRGFAGCDRRGKACLIACTLGGAWGKDFVEQSGAEFQTGLNIRNQPIFLCINSCTKNPSELYFKACSFLSLLAELNSND
jgi:hypothetical protein